MCKSLLGALAYCHKQNVAHRLLKPESLFLCSDADDSDIMLADFSYAHRVTSDKCLKTQCGTPGYVAPEILTGVAYGTKADMWSIGVIVYILLGGYPPFIDSNQRELFRKIRKGSYEFEPEYWGKVSKDAKDLILSLLTVDPDARISAEEALHNPWITVSDDALAGKDLGKNLEQFKKFNARRKFKAAVTAVRIHCIPVPVAFFFQSNLIFRRLTYYIVLLQSWHHLHAQVVATNKMKALRTGGIQKKVTRKLAPHEIEEMRETFDMFDADGGGEYSVSQTFIAKFFCLSTHLTPSFATAHMIRITQAQSPWRS